MMKPTGARKRQEGDYAPRRHPKRVQRSTELPTVGAAALQQQHQAWTEYARVELRALQTREPAALAQLLIRLDRHGCELRVVRRYCEEHAVTTSTGQRGPRGWWAEAGALGAVPGIFWRWCSLLGAALAEPWWALFPTQVRSRCPSLVSLSGIVLVETRHTLVLQGEDGAKRRVPKAGSTFMLTLPAVDGGHPLTVHLRGEQLTRAAKG